MTRDPLIPAPAGANLFARPLVSARRARSFARDGAPDFLIARAAQDMADRLAEIERHFAPVLLQGARNGLLRRTLSCHSITAGRLEGLIETDIDPRLVPWGGVVADEERLPFGAAGFGAVLSLMTLHWVNDLPGALAQIARALRPDGLFLATLFGGDTLIELREALAEAEIEAEGGLSPRVSPFLALQDGAALLQRAGFALPVADRDRVTVTYETPLHLMQELKAMGESNALIERRRTPMRRATLYLALQRYAEKFPAPGGRIKATFDIITLTGWAPHASQQKPLRPGSAKTRLAAALGTTEQRTHERKLD